MTVTCRTAFDQNSLHYCFIYSETKLTMIFLCILLFHLVSLQLVEGSLDPHRLIVCCV